jgi:hypothetical protein
MPAGAVGVAGLVGPGRVLAAMAVQYSRSELQMRSS